MAQNTPTEDVITLPKLIFPAFPKSYCDKLPEGVTWDSVDMNAIDWNAAPLLWAELPEHKFFEPFNKTESGYYPWTLVYVQQIQEQCDIKSVMKRLITHWDNLANGKLSQREEMLELRLREWIKFLHDINDEKRWDALPNLYRLGDITNELFFQGCLGFFRYAWTNLQSNGQQIEDGLLGWHPSFFQYAWTSLESNGQQIEDGLLGWHQQNRIATVPVSHPQACNTHYHHTKRPVDRMIGALLHEQLHAVLNLYLCNGHCSWGSPEQRALCAYLSARTVSLFTKVSYKNEIHSCNKYNGHGGVFCALARQLRELIEQRFGLTDENILGRIVRTCECTRPPTSVTHCCDSYIKMQFEVKAELDRLNVKPASESK